MSAGAAADACDFQVVRVRDVSRHYGRRRALAGVSFECHAGSLTGLFGPNGAGKSTLLGVLSTLHRPTSGTVTFGDRAAGDWGDVLRGRIGMLGHDLFLYPELTARENLEFFGHLYGVPNLAERIDNALRTSALVERAGDRVSGFSRGMRQRLALERALLNDPRLVLLDEPFTGLDDASVERLSLRLRALRDLGAIVVMATHDIEIAGPLVDTAICLQRGRLLEIAAGPEPLRVRYRRTVEAGA